MALYEELHVVNALVPVADAFAATKYTDIIKLAKHHKITFVIITGANAGGDSVVTVEACDDVTPTNSSAIAFRYKACTSGDTFGAMAACASTGFTTSTTANSMYVVEVTSDMLTQGYEYVRLKLVEDTDNAVTAGIAAILSDGRYQESVMDTAIV